MHRLIFASLAVLSLSACGEPVDTSPDTAETPMPVEPDGGIGDGATPLPEPAPTSIPASMSGRWGMVSGDCTDERGDAKGAIEVSDKQLRFYESRATLGEISASSPTSIRATYAYTGEGYDWTRDVELALSDDGKQLVLTEYGPDAMDAPITYTKCPF